MTHQHTTSIRILLLIVLLVLLVLLLLPLIHLLIPSPPSPLEPFISFNHPRYTPIYNTTGARFDRRTRTLTTPTHRYTISRRNNVNHPSSAALTTSKHVTSRVLELHNIPTPPYVYIHTLAHRRRPMHYTKAEFRALLEPLRDQYPLTIKPVDGTRGRNITLNIRSLPQLRQVYARRYQHLDVLVQKHLMGVNYRALVVNHTVLEVIRFEKPYVVGDGQRTLQQLVARHQQQHRQRRKDPRTMVDWRAIPFPSTYVPPPQHRVIISHNTNNFQNHGTTPTQVVPLDKIHPNTLAMFRRIHTVMGLTMSGVDCNIIDVGQPCEAMVGVPSSSDGVVSNGSGGGVLLQQNGYVLEVNSNPGVEVHSGGMGGRVVRGLVGG